MRLRLLLLVSTFVLLGIVGRAQDSVTKTMAGVSGDNYRVLIAFIAVNGDVYHAQSFILDINKVKKGDEPSSFYLDLTSTDRSIGSGSKKQKILVQRWMRDQDIEAKCEAGKWTKQSKGGQLDEITDIVKLVIKSAPLDASDPVEFTLPPEVEKNVRHVLDSLATSNLQCVRNGSD